MQYEISNRMSDVHGSAIRELFKLGADPNMTPRHFATSALPPVPIMNPTPPSIIRNGITRFTEANAVLPTKFDTKYPSTTPYIDVKTIITIDGRQNRMSRGSVK